MMRNPLQGDRVKVWVNAHGGYAVVEPYTGTIIDVSETDILPYTVRLDGGYTDKYGAQELTLIPTFYDLTRQPQT